MSETHRRRAWGIVATARRTAGARELPKSRAAPRQPSISHQLPSPHAAAPRTALAPNLVEASSVTGARSTATQTLTRTSSSAPQSRRTSLRLSAQSVWSWSVAGRHRNADGNALRLPPTQNHHGDNLAA